MSFLSDMVTEKKVSNIFWMRVVGTTFIEGVPEFLRKLKYNIKDTNCILLKLVPDKENQYDTNAVSVLLSLKGIGKYKKIGYIPREKAKYIKGILESNTYRVVISKVFLNGGVYDYENVGLAFNFYITKR